MRPGANLREPSGSKITEPRKAAIVGQALVTQSGQADSLHPDELRLRQLTVAVTVKQFLDFRRSATALAFDRMIHAHQRAEFSHPPVDAVGQVLTFHQP